LSNKGEMMETNDQDLLHKLYKLEWLLRRFMVMNGRGRGPMGAPYQGQGRILSLLKLKPEISQKDLAHILDIRSQSLGELLVKLERSGFITRTPSESDRRGMDIRLTESGRAASEKDEEPARMDSFFDCLNDAEQTTLGDYLGRVIQSLEDRLAASGSEPFAGQRPDFRGRDPGGLFRRGEGGPPPDRRGSGRFFDRDAPGFPFGDRGAEPPSKDED
jgi:DNA-binding MarR family transcriptional regulator